MSIDEWLHRLNLLHLKENFYEHKIWSAGDLAYIKDAELFSKKMNINAQAEKRRLWNMMSGEESTKENF